jgi:hypothetical protein
MEKKRRAWTVIWEYNKVSQVLANPFAIVNTAKAHASVYRMREQAAVFTCECLCEWLNSRDLRESCRLLLLLSYVVQIYMNLFTRQNVLQLFYGLIFVSYIVCLFKKTISLTLFRLLSFH